MARTGASRRTRRAECVVNGSICQPSPPPPEESRGILRDGETEEWFSLPAGIVNSVVLDSSGTALPRDYLKRYLPVFVICYEVCRLLMAQ